MASQKVSALSSLTTADSSDLLYVADTSDSGTTYTSKSITVGNLFYGYATEAYVTTEINNLVNSAPGALDTLNELAAAINDDVNFSTTVTNLVADNEVHIDNVVALSGVGKDSTSLGTFTGTTISDNVTIKDALQSLETAFESSGPATVSIGTVTTGNPGTNVSVTNSGSGSAAVLNFIIPEGNTGPEGPQGPTGLTGPVGPAGPAGADGNDGADGSNGLNGTNGQDGADGVNVSSAAITNDELILTLSDSTTINAGNVRGPQGSQGIQGNPGADGNDGIDGTNGISPTISIGTIATGAAGSSAFVTNSGTSTNVTLNFTLPRGDTGATGPTGATGANGGTDIVLDTTPQLGGNLESNGNNIQMADNDQIILGDGNDLKIYHDGNNSLVGDFGTGNLILAGNTSIDLMNPGGTEYYAIFNKDGSVELYHDNSKKFETTASGIDVTGLTDTDTLNVSSTSAFASTVTITPVNAEGLVINSGSQTDTYPHLVLKGAGPQVIDFRDDNNNDGIRISYRTFPNEWRLEKSEDSTYYFIVVDRDDGRVDLYYNNAKKLETTSTGIDVTGHTETDTLNVSSTSTFQSHVSLGDDDELRFGANNDFKIVHDPNDCRFENSNGDIKFKNTGSYFFFDEDGGETLASFINDGAVNLFHDGSKKLETTSTGVTVTGTCVATEFSGSGASLTGVVKSDTTGITGASTVSNIVTISQSDYDAISSPDANTIYYVTS